MDMDTFWGLIDRARSAVGGDADDRDGPADPLPQALVEVLATLEPTEIVDFWVRYVEVTDSAYRYPLWRAASLIEDGCSDDGFMDFRDGLVLLGRDTFVRAVDDPDTLASLPVVVRMSQGDGWLGYESLSYLIQDAYRRRQGETDSFDAAVEAAAGSLARPQQPQGEDWDPSDTQQARRHLPRLAELFLD